jgi:hypothetical protein
MYNGAHRVLRVGQEQVRVVGPALGQLAAFFSLFAPV